MHVLYALICFVFGSGIAWMGYWLSARLERPRGAPGFAGPIFSRYLLIGWAPNFLLIIGLIIAVIFSLIFLLT